MDKSVWTLILVIVLIGLFGSFVYYNDEKMLGKIWLGVVFWIIGIVIMFTLGDSNRNK